MGKTSKAETGDTFIKYVGIGTINYIKSKKDTKGVFWTLNNNEYLLLDARSSTVKESSFTSYEEFKNYCLKQFPNGRIVT